MFMRLRKVKRDLVGRSIGVRPGVENPPCVPAPFDRSEGPGVIGRFVPRITLREHPPAGIYARIFAG